MIDKLKEAGVEKVGSSTQPAGRTVDHARSGQRRSSIERARDADGLSRMVVVSLFAHAALLAGR